MQVEVLLRVLLPRQAVSGTQGREAVLSVQREATAHRTGRILFLSLSPTKSLGWTYRPSGHRPGCGGTQTLEGGKGGPHNLKLTLIWGLGPQSIESSQISG